MKKKFYLYDVNRKVIRNIYIHIEQKTILFTTFCNKEIYMYVCMYE